MKIVPRTSGDDSGLLERYLASRDQAAFTALAGAHLGLIYSAALRITRSPDLAEEVVQTVLIKLATLKRPLPAKVPLDVWLHRVTRSAAIDLVRSEERRRQRETVAAALAGESAENLWDRLSPVIDEVIAQLPARDRELILSRFFTGSSHGAMARTLGMTEDAVRMRLKRAMEKMRVLLERRGIATSAALLALCLPAHAGSVVPPEVLVRLPRLVPPPPRAEWLLRLWRALSPARPIQAAVLAALSVLGVTAGLMLAERSATTACAEAEAVPPPPPVESLPPADPHPGFENETADHLGVPPRKMPAAPPDEMEAFGPQLEVVIKLDTTAPGYLSA